MYTLSNNNSCLMTSTYYSMFERTRINETVHVSRLQRQAIVSNQ